MGLQSHCAQEDYFSFAYLQERFCTSAELLRKILAPFPSFEQKKQCYFRSDFGAIKLAVEKEQQRLLRGRTYCELGQFAKRIGRTVKKTQDILERKGIPILTINGTLIVSLKETNVYLENLAAQKKRRDFLEQAYRQFETED